MPLRSVHRYHAIAEVNNVYKGRLFDGYPKSYIFKLFRASESILFPAVFAVVRTHQSALGCVVG
jgi:hypothetical protein